jgi:hypothetical protein
VELLIIWGYGEQVHCLSVNYRLDRDSYAGCSLSDMYARYNELESAMKVSSRIEAPDLVAWNSLMNAYPVEGPLSEAMILFSEIRISGLRPDDVTVKGLLCACLGSDALQHGRTIHSLVKLGLNGNISVCNSLLSMYARCLDFPSAMDVFNETNDRDIVTWNGILTVCVEHRYLEEVFKLVSRFHRSVSSVRTISLNNVPRALAAWIRIHRYIIF